MTIKRYVTVVLLSLTLALGVGVNSASAQFPDNPPPNDNLPWEIVGRAIEIYEYRNLFLEYALQIEVPTVISVPLNRVGFVIGLWNEYYTWTEEYYPYVYGVTYNALSTFPYFQDYSSNGHYDSYEFNISGCVDCTSYSYDLPVMFFASTGPWAAEEYCGGEWCWCDTDWDCGEDFYCDWDEGGYCLSYSPPPI